jgi:rare lipoprotein A
MVLLAVKFLLRNCRDGFWRAGCALTLLITAFTHAKADPRIDPDTATTQAQQRASLQKGPDGLIQQAGVASWYGRHWRGRKTASGMIFDERQLTAASLVLPLATRARVTNVQNGRSVDVLVNDRGPYAGNRVMDLSERAAALLGITKSGLAQVVIRVHLAQAAATVRG